MTYKAEKIGDLQFQITLDGEENSFIVVCGQSEDEVPELVAAHLESIKRSQEPVVPTYNVLRHQEYPPITDYLDGIVKGDQAQIDKYIADCLAVKEKYPKPSAA